MRALLLLLFPLAAFGQVTTYAYQGQPYDANGNAISGFIELSNPLFPNSTVTISPDVQAFTISASSPLSLPQGYFTLTTDANGDIVGWGFTNAIDFACSCSIDYTSSDAGDSVEETKPYYPTVSFGTAPSGHWTTITGSPIATLTTQVNSYRNGYMAENATIKAQNQALVQLKLQVFYLNAQVAKCRTNQGRC